MKLYSIVNELADCNDLDIRPVRQWPTCINIDLLEKCALKIPDELIHEYVDGEKSDIERITKVFDIQPLTDFLNSVFDGELHENLIK